MRNVRAHTCVVSESDANQRLDSFIAAETPLSRSRVQWLLEHGMVRVNDEVGRKPSYRVQPGDRVDVEVPPAKPLELEASEIPLDILYEDSHLVVIAKPAGMVVHPGPGHQSDTLVNALLAHVDDLSGIGGALRPGIVHRLDQDTTGVLVVAKDDTAHQGLSSQLGAHDVERVYVALVAHLRGQGLQDEGTFDTLHGRHPKDRKRFTTTVDRGRRAVTHYRVIERFGQGVAKVECRLETGRTHQIRVHFSEYGCPIIGDRVYGGRAMKSTSLIDRQALHALSLGFVHPVSGEDLRFEAELPEDFKHAEETLRRGGSWR